MKQDFYTENAVVVLSDGDTYSRINDASVLLFNVADKDILCDFEGIKDFVNFDDEYMDGNRPQDLVHGHIHIDFLLKFYLKHRDQHGDEL
jgi:hypothetical protein